MKKTGLTITVSLWYSIIFADGDRCQISFGKIKKETKIDSNDRTICNLLDGFDEQNPQADNDEMNSETIEKFRKLASDPGTKTFIF